MRKVIYILAVTLMFGSAVAQADEATEKEVKQTIIDSNNYTKKNLKGMTNDYSKDGAVEFWSSGGFMQMIGPNERPGEFDFYNLEVKHIHVTTIVPGKVAVAHYYSEGSMKPKGSAAVGNYRTRATQVFVKEGKSWKVRSSHWSAIAGGSGTSQTALDE